MLLECKTNNFMSVKVRGLLAQNHKNGLGKWCSSTGSVQFMPGVSGEMDGTHGGVLLFHVDGSEPPDWNDIEACIKYLREKGVPVDDAKCFDQVTNLKKFTEWCNSDGDFEIF